MQRFSRIASALTVVAAIGCTDGNSSPVHFASLDDGDHVGGAEVTRLTVDHDVGPSLAELYLDDVLVATDETSPFDLAWTTAGRPESGAELRARVYRNTGGFVERTITVEIDHTPPSLTSITGSAARGDILHVSARDNGPIERIVVVHGHGIGSSEPATPLEVPWSGWCGVETVEVTITDQAGWTTSGTITVHTADAFDGDCDGHRSPEVADGTDCDDRDPQVYPGAVDVVGGVDSDCNGAP
jgi:hypothetical protein